MKKIPKIYVISQEVDLINVIEIRHLQRGNLQNNSFLLLEK